MARVIVSTGTDASRAFCTIVRSVAFDSVSPPPARAATSIWRMRTANSLPRRASAAPFLCLIECHLLWPLMPAFSDGGRSALQEPRVDAQVARELGVEA